MPEDFDIGRVIQGGSRQMDLGDLAKMGHKKVRVINEQRIRELITQAVQAAIERESADSTGRARREAAEKTRSELEGKLAEYQRRLDGEKLASKEVEKLRGELAGLQSRMRESSAVIESEKKRLAEESQREFNKLLKNAQQEVQDKKGLYEKALREMIGTADRVMPREDAEDLPVVAAGDDVPGTEMLDALNRRVERLGHLLDESRNRLNGRDQDVAMAAAEHRRQQIEIDRLRKENEALRLDVRERERKLDAIEQDVSVAAVERRKQQEVIDRLGRQLDESREESRERQRQIDQREQDVAMAALEQRRLREELNRARTEAARAGEMDGEVRRLTSERDLLLARIEEMREREREAATVIATLTGKLGEIQGTSAKTSGELMQAISGMKGSIGEEVARQVAWALSAQKTGASSIDPGLQLDALFSRDVETNIEVVKVEERQDNKLKEKLAKLKETRGKGGS